MRTRISGTGWVSALLLAALGVGAVFSAGCGASAEWVPPPAVVIPVAPAESDNAPSGQGLAELEAMAGAMPEEPPSEAPKPAGPSPMAADLPQDVEGKLSAHEVCAQKECAIAGLYPPLVSIDGKAPAALWSHDLGAENTSLVFPKHRGVDLYGVVLKGKAAIMGAERGAARKDAVPWTAFRAPGAGVSVVAAAPNTRIVFALVGDGEPIAETVVKLRGKDGKKLAWNERPSPVALSDLKASSDLAWGGGAMHARIGFEGEGQRASLGLLMASKDAPVPEHRHDTSWEFLAVLSVDGTLKRADSAASTETKAIPLTDGQVVMIPKAHLHAFQPGNTKNLVAIQLYLPPGPEQRFKKLANPQ